MFTEFLHPELVLFGEFINPKLKCSHKIETEDGEIVIHQAINRQSKIVPSKEQMSYAEHIQMMKQELEERKAMGEEAYYQFMDKQANNYQEREEDYEDYGDYEDGDDDQDDNLYGLGSGGYQMEGKYVAPQFAALLSQASLDNSPQKNQRVPLGGPFKKGNEGKQKKKENQEEEEDDGWQTEEQEEEYVTAEMLQEVGGTFEGELGQM